MSNKIEMGKTYRTRDGRPVRVLCVDAKHAEPVVALVPLVNEPNWENSYHYRSDGTYVNGATKHGLDLVEVRPRIKRTVWVNVYSEPLHVCIHESRSSADNESYDKRLACVQVDIDVEEGYGL